MAAAIIWKWLISTVDNIGNDHIDLHKKFWFPILYRSGDMPFYREFKTAVAAMLNLYRKYLSGRWSVQNGVLNLQIKSRYNICNPFLRYRPYQTVLTLDICGSGFSNLQRQ